MFIDYLTLMLINLVGGLVVLAGWIYFDPDGKDTRRWVPGLLMSGGIGLITGLHMILTWPLPGSFNILFGEMSVFFAVLLLGVAFCIWFAVDMVGVQVILLGLTKSPALTGVGFIWMGIVGVCAVPMLTLRRSQAFRVFGAVGLVIAALLWAISGYSAYWGHVEPFAKWKPLSLQYQLEMNQPKPPAQQ
jgi:putative membrane protein